MSSRKITLKRTKKQIMLRDRLRISRPMFYKFADNSHQTLLFLLSSTPSFKLENTFSGHAVVNLYTYARRLKEFIIINTRCVISSDMTVLHLRLDKDSIDDNSERTNNKKKEENGVLKW